MYPWIALGCFLLGAGVGSLTSAALHAKEIGNLKSLLESARNLSQIEDRLMEEKLRHGEVRGNADYSGRPVGRIVFARQAEGSNLGT